MKPEDKRNKNTLNSISEFIREKAVKAISSNTKMPIISKAAQLKAEVDLLTSYSADTIYRLRYDTMKYDYISPAIVRLLGFTPKEMESINFRSLIVETRIISSGMKKVESYADLEERRKTGEVDKWQADYLIRTRDGRKIWVSDISYPWFDEKGSVIGSIGSLRDITERVKVEEEVREELAKIANLDPLTGLSNRREFFVRVDEELKRIKRNNGDLSILLIDVDHFKKVNDSYGHDVGDFVLIELAKIITSCLRETDLAARLGGEEFGVFLPDTPMEGAFWVAERIRTTVGKHIFNPGSDKLPLGCTVSVGVASAGFIEQYSATELYKLADTRLYIAKNTGRNQVSVDEIVSIH